MISKLIRGEEFAGRALMFKEVSNEFKRHVLIAVAYHRFNFAESRIQ